MELKTETLQTAKEYIVKLKVAIGNTIEKYRNGTVQEYESLLDIIEGLRWTVDVMILTQDIHIGDAKNDSVKNKIKELLNAFEQKDNILIADIFEYEILEILQNYEKVILDTLKLN